MHDTALEAFVSLAHLILPMMMWRSQHLHVFTEFLLVLANQSK